MDKEKQEKIAIFRFGVIFPLVECSNRKHWGEKEKVLRDLVSREWDIPFSQRIYISRATILNWYRHYEQGGRKIEALFPRCRDDRGRSRSVDNETIDVLVRMKNENPLLTVPRLMEKAQALGLFPPGKEVSLATVYRLMKIHTVKTKKKQEDLRKFEVQMSNDLWQSDCMHGPKVLYEGRNRKTYLFAIIDDHSRLIPHGQFYMAESLDNYLDCLWSALRKRGVPRKLYVDNGPAFRSHRLKLGCASLGIGLSYARPYRPQGKGKIERFFRTVRGQLLVELPENLTVEELNTRFFAYIENTYHVRRHGSTGQTPLERYLEDGPFLRRAPDDLPDYFRKKEVRVVNNDRTVKLDGHMFEAPAGLISHKVTLRFETYERIEVFDGEVSKGFLSPLDPEINSRTKRANSSPSSGGMLFERLETGEGGL